MKRQNVEVARELKLKLGREKYELVKSLAKRLRRGKVSPSLFLGQLKDLKVDANLTKKMIESLPNKTLRKELHETLQKYETSGSSCLIVIHFHHLLSEFKREMIIDVAKQLNVHFCMSCFGTPGVLIIEATIQAIMSFLKVLRSQRWQTMDIRAVRTVLFNRTVKLRDCFVFFPDKNIIEVRSLWFELNRVETESSKLRCYDVHGHDFNGFEFVRNVILSNHTVPKRLFQNPKLPLGDKFSVFDGIPPDFLHARTYSELRADKNRQNFIRGLVFDC